MDDKPSLHRHDVTPHRRIRRRSRCAMALSTCAAMMAWAGPPLAMAQDAALAQPKAYSVVYENAVVRALDYRSRPGLGVCGSGVHSHPAHLTVALWDGPARVRKAGDKEWTTVQSRIGDVFWSEAETHEVENLSGREAHALLIELKTP